MLVRPGAPGTCRNTATSVVKATQKCSHRVVNVEVTDHPFLRRYSHALVLLSEIKIPIGRTRRMLAIGWRKSEGMHVFDVVCTMLISPIETAAERTGLTEERQRLVDGLTIAVTTDR